MPLFSIIIPTRNRGRLLKNAIQSVLDQTFSDFELVISDNASEDNTEQLARSFTDKRVKYFKTGRYLLAHNNSENAYRNSTGDYVLLIGDDDVLIPQALEQISKVIRKNNAKLVLIGLVTYYDSTFEDPMFRDVISACSFSGKVLAVNSEEVLRAYFNLEQARGYPPHASCIAISRDITSEISRKCGAFFLPPYAEVVFMPIAALKAGKVYVIDKPLILIGRGSNSQVVLERANPSQMWQHIELEFKHVMFKGKYTFNAHVESLLRAKSYYLDKFRNYEIDIVKYSCLYFDNIIDVGRKGAGYDENLAEFYKGVAKLPVTAVMRIRMHSALYMAKKFIKVLLKVKMFRKIKILTRFKRHSGYAVTASSIGVNNIMECRYKLSSIAKKLNETPENWEPSIEARY